MVHPAKFDRQQVVDAAMELFWQHGFAATSTRDLQQALGMHPGSIYAAFGSKAGLYREALDCYAASMASQLMAHMEQHESILAGFKGFFRALLGAEAGATARMCLLVKTQIELAGDDSALKELAASHLKHTEARFSQLLARACARGELPADTDTRALARYLQVQMMGLRSYLVCSGDHATAERMIEQLFADHGST